jgi:hypothetical protein
MRPLWHCPRCGVGLLTKNLWHSCGRATVEDWRRRMGPRARALYDRLEAMIAACGPYERAPASTRIAFLGRVRFAGVTAASEAGITINFALPEPVRAARFARVYEVVPGWWVHRLRITDPDQLDAQLQRWLKRSYDLMGMQGRLRRPPKSGRTTCQERP